MQAKLRGGGELGGGKANKVVLPCGTKRIRRHGVKRNLTGLPIQGAVTRRGGGQGGKWQKKMLGTTNPKKPLSHGKISPVKLPATEESREIQKKSGLPGGPEKPVGGKNRGEGRMKRLSSE